jgi:hypothetical protein
MGEGDLTHPAIDPPLCAVLFHLHNQPHMVNDGVIKHQAQILDFRLIIFSNQWHAEKQTYLEQDEESLD